MRFAFAAASVLTLACCKPPATDDYVARVGLDKRQGPGEPIDSPDTEGAVWAPSREEGRIIYGIPGDKPLMTLACETGGPAPVIRYTRNAPADPEAQAVLALIGNGHVARLWIDAEEAGTSWRWVGKVPADDPRLEALTGGRQIEATVPGAGSLILNPSRLPGELVGSCRQRSRPQTDEEATPVAPE